MSAGVWMPDSVRTVLLILIIAFCYLIVFVAGWCIGAAWQRIRERMPP